MSAYLLSVSFLLPLTPPTVSMPRTVATSPAHPAVFYPLLASSRPLLRLILHCEMPSFLSLHTKILTVIQNLATDSDSFVGFPRSLSVCPSLPHVLLIIIPILTTLLFVPPLILIIIPQGRLYRQRNWVKKVNCQDHSLVMGRTRIPTQAVCHWSLCPEPL